MFGFGLGRPAVCRTRRACGVVVRTRIGGAGVVLTRFVLGGVARSRPIAGVLAVLGRHLELSLGQAFVVVAVSVIGLAVPAPAGVGGFHWAIRFGLTQLIGVDVSTSTAFALLHHAICFFPITVLGLGYLAAVGMSLGKVRTMEAKASPDPEAR